jgi:FkbM family methyltransferase
VTQSDREMGRRRGIRRRLAVVLGAVLLIAAAVGALESFERGQAFLVRSYVRTERAWERYFPLDRGKRLVRGLDPLMFRIGLLRSVRVEVEPGISLLLDPADDISRTILISMASKWEPEVWAAISSGLSDGSVFLDVGAHIGYDSLRASVSVGKNGQVIAFEPNPNTLAILRANVAASRATNVIVEPIACTDTEQMLTLFDSTLGGNSGSSSLSQRNAGSITRPYTVRGRPIDDVVNELGLKRVDVLKADVEGAELLVLRGASQTLKRFHPKLILEVVPRQLKNMNASVEELESFVKALGYNATRSVDYKNREWTIQ